MQVLQIGKDLKIKYFGKFDLSHTLDCGQCFRWSKTDFGYEGIVGSNYLEISQCGDELILKNTSDQVFEKFWKNYFDFGIDYEKIGKSFANVHPVIKKAYEYCGGIHILRQDPWESLCSFIISQNNNIPRIKKIVSCLCTLFGEKINHGFSFPSAESLSTLSEKDLEPIRSGFRAKYILDAARKVANLEVNFTKIQNMDFLEAKKSLMQISGVGPKIADCVLLYGFHRLEAFPVDVWMKKIMEKFFKGESPHIFGQYAGVAQQYLYHYSRTGTDLQL